MAWRNEKELKQENQSYEDKYKEIEGDILCNITKHEPYMDIDYNKIAKLLLYSIRQIRR